MYCPHAPCHFYIFNKAVHPSLLPCGTLVVKRLVQVNGLTHPAVALALFVATGTVPVAVPSVIAGASSVLESTERVAGEVAEPL
jgi:hypothetical protein